VPLWVEIGVLALALALVVGFSHAPVAGLQPQTVANPHQGGLLGQPYAVS